MTKLTAENVHPADANIIRLLLQLRKALVRRTDFSDPNSTVSMSDVVTLATDARNEDGLGLQFAADEPVAQIAIMLEAWVTMPLLDAPPKKDWRPVTVHNIVNGGAA